MYIGNIIDGGERNKQAVSRRLGLGSKSLNSMPSMLCGERHTWNIKEQIYKMSSLS